MSLFVYLLQIYIYTAYIMYIYIYLIRFFNWNLARICQEVASPFALFFDVVHFHSGQKICPDSRRYMKLYTEIYMHVCVCVCYPSVSFEVPNARLLFDWQSEGRINCLSGNAIAFTITLEKTRVRDKRERERERGNWKLRTDLAFANC